MPDDPFRLRVQKQVCAIIKTVTPDNGYTYDLSDFSEDGVTFERVFRGRTDFGDDDPRPMVAINEHPDALDMLMPAGSGGDALGGWRLMVQGFVVDHERHPTDTAYQVCAEVVMAIVKTRKKYDVLGLGGRAPCVNDFKIGSPVVRPATQGIADCAWFAFVLSLDLVEDLENPFA